MKHKNYLFILALFICLLLAAGCSGKNNAAEVEHQQLIWQKQREKPFGTFDYPEISEDEALDLLKNKFEVKVPEIIPQTKKLFDEKIITTNLEAKKVEYSLYASGNDLLVRGYYPVYKGEELIVFALIDLKYSFDKEQKEVRLASQSLALSNYGKEEAYPKDNFNELLLEVAQNIDISKDTADLAIQNFEKDYKEVDKRPASKTVVVYGNDEEAEEKKLVSQTLRVGFNDKREFREIHAAIIDYTE
ncbi:MULTISPECIES: hypothetical protein [unclassified Enterococcus]|uniref:hypothetical protein n=1 Tax=unclassified Enterococcus TaxID=2608891 RepID=UPI001CE0435E|nr:MULTISPECIES: hypothetical protein [unclassified Enterococcus]MCA5011843.1 hypothetical protein [Enterococcus sp. S23]MCA5014715.1 hypothetical protein [Enterococcus sp. S22(2020)]